MTSTILNVTASATGRHWVGLSPEEDRLSEALAQRADIAPALARVLARRGVLPETADSYLAPALRDLLPDPLRLKDMGVAATRVLAAMADRERIAIFADYDVDGASRAMPRRSTFPTASTRAMARTRPRWPSSPHPTT